MTLVVKRLILFCLLFLSGCSNAILQDFSGEIYGTTYSIKIAENSSYAKLESKIKNELKQKGVNESLFNEIQEGTDWSILALKVLEKKVKGKFPEEKKEVLKLKNFLNYRGFNFHHIDNAFSMIEIE